MGLVILHYKRGARELLAPSTTGRHSEGAISEEQPSPVSECVGAVILEDFPRLELRKINAYCL